MAQTSLERAVERASNSLAARGIQFHVHSQRCMNILKHILYKGEETVLETRESYWKGIAPPRLVATKKRLILANPSFWGLYTGHDITRPTTYVIMPYKYIIGVTLARGLFFSSIRIHTSSGMDTGTVGSNETEIHSVDTRQAAIMARFIEEIVEYEGEEERVEVKEPARPQERYQVRSAATGIDVWECRRLVGAGKARLVWMGVEPIDEVARVMGVKVDGVIQMSGSGMLRQTADQIGKMGQVVLVSYDGIAGEHTASMVRKKYGLDVKVLKGGIMQAARDVKDDASKFLS